VSAVTHNVVSREEWLRARAAFLAQEKEKAWVRRHDQH